MNVSKFNDLLKKKIRAAKNYEELNDREKAIETWIKVSELTLKQSKNPNIDHSYRNYLIQKTRQIIDYIKRLKTRSRIEGSETRGAKELKRVQREQTTSKIREKNESAYKQQRSKQKKGSAEKRKSLPSEVNDDSKENSNDGRFKDEEKKGHSQAINDLESEFRNMPSGFQKINPSQDFSVSDIKTPLDEDKIREKQNQDVDMSIFQHNKEKKKDEKHKKQKSEVFKSDRQDEPLEGSICFACGTKLKEGQNVCPNCGTTQN